MAEPLDEDVRLAARTYAPDHYLAALLAPAAVRNDLVALAAFLGDVDRIIATVSDPTLAEIRLQWWRDAIIGGELGARSGHPVADALGGAIRRHHLPFGWFDGLLDARSFDLYADQVPDAATFDAYLEKADGAAFALAALMIDPAASVPSQLVRATGRAYGWMRLLRTSAIAQRRGRDPFPPSCPTRDDRAARARDVLTTARTAWRRASRKERAACLPLAVVEPYLDATQREGYDPATMVADISPLTRAWRLWSAHVTGRC
jgi:15-cis-phytoene synthase